MNFFKKLIKSQCAVAKCMRILSVLDVITALCFVFAIDNSSYYDEFPFTITEWLLLVFIALVSAVVTYGFATIIDAAHLYVKAHAPQDEDEYDY